MSRPHHRCPTTSRALLRRLRLPHIRRHAPQVVATAKAQRWEPVEVLRALLGEEAAGRERSALATRRSIAGFPTGKTFEAWDPQASSIPAPTQQALRTLEWVKLSRHGPVLVVVDQPATIGALPAAVARDAGVDVAYLPGLAMRRIADLHPGNSKTDARDAYVIAEAARWMPHALRRVDVDEEALADLEVIVGFDDDLAAEVTRVTNRIHGLLTQIHPALERAIGAWLDHKAVLELLSRFGGPTGLRAAGRRRLSAVAKPRAPRIHAKIIGAIMAALESVLVPGTAAAELVLPKLANQLAELPGQRAETAPQVEEMLDAHPLSPVLTSMPGIGVRTGARIRLEVGDGSAFPTPEHLAAYAGLTPITRRSGTSIRGEHPNRGGNKKLKNAMFQAAFASLNDPTSRAYYDRKRDQKKKHNAAIICLARRRCDVLFAMLRNGTLYEPRTRSAA